MKRLAFAAMVILFLVFSCAAHAEQKEVGYAEVEAQPATVAGTGGYGTSGPRSPGDILDEIERLLAEVKEAMGGRFVVVVKKDSQEDQNWLAKFQSWNGRLDSLWKEFAQTLSADVDFRRMNRDEQFQSEMNKAFMQYRGAFGGGQEDPTRAYADLRNKAKQKRFTLRQDVPLFSWWGFKRLGIDKKVELAKGVAGFTFSGNPTQWGDDDLVYAIGLLPNELLRDVNKSIQAAYFYGYLAEWYSLDPSRIIVPEFSIYAWSAYGSLTYDYVWADEYFYYTHIYNNTDYLYSSLANQFSATQPRHGTGAGSFDEMRRSLDAAKAVVAKAENFKDRNSKIILKNGETYIPRTVSRADGEKLLSDYELLADDFKAAMQNYRRYLDDYRRNFPGDETGTLQKGMQSAFQTYRVDFVYNEMDYTLTRYDALKDSTKNFELDRRSTWGALNKHLHGPGWWNRPRSNDLYSAQRVLTLLPADMRNKIDDRRRWAYQRGQWAARAEYRNPNDYEYGTTIYDEDATIIYDEGEEFEQNDLEFENESTEGNL